MMEDGSLAIAITNQERLGFLDSIRGVAVLIVVVGHCWLLNSDAFRIAHYGMGRITSISTFSLYIISKIETSGRSAVIMFFVLSGFVLSYSLQKHPLPYLGYLIKRVFRIYPAFLFTILVSYFLHRIIGVQHEVTSEWVKSVIIDLDLTFDTLLKHLALWGTIQGQGLDAVIWSLVHEMRISLIFPFIFFVVKRYTWRSLLVFWTLSIVCTIWSLDLTGMVILGYQEATFARSFLDTGFFIVFFAAGAYLAIERQTMMLKIANLSKRMKALLLLVLIYCLLKSGNDLYSIMGSVADYIRAAGALGLIAFALSVKQFGQALTHSVLSWLGRISYSLYLVHIPMLYVINQTIGESWPVIQTSIVLIALSLLAAELMATLIEYPSINLGKLICSKLPVLASTEEF